MSLKHLVPAVLACAALLGACSQEAPETETTETEEEEVVAVPVEVGKPTRGDIAAVYSGTAPIEAFAEADVIAKVGGEVVGLGRWEVYPWGLWFNLRDADANHELSFFSQLLLNPFGPHSKLLQGTILLYSRQANENPLVDLTEDEKWFFASPNRRWFRPVIGTFSARGIGKDTADLSYKQRAIGLSS